VPRGGFDELRQRRTSYSCADGRTFDLVLIGVDERFAVVVDQGRAFNLTGEPTSTGKQYGDGTILIHLDGNRASFAVEGKPYLRDCTLK